MAAISGALYHRLHTSSFAGMYLYEFIFYIFNNFHKPELVTYQNKKTTPDHDLCKRRFNKDSQSLKRHSEQKE